MKPEHLPHALWRFFLVVSAAVLLASCASSRDTATPVTTEARPATRSPSPATTNAPPSTASPTLTPQPTPAYAPSPIQPSATSLSGHSETISPLPTPAHSPPADQSTATSQSLGRGLPIYSYRIVNNFPHDPAAWTQGLVIHDGVLYEGTGQKGRSSLRRVDIQTGDVLQLHSLPDTLYGEGVAVVDDRIVQLTYRNQLGLVYDRESFELLQTFNYPTEGWGLTYDGQQLIMSDGTANLYFLDPETFERTRQIEVSDERGPLARLNELEYVEGEVWANVWYQDAIARIDPETGEVTGWIDLSSLRHAGGATMPGDILNGIAYDAGGGRLFVTGKLWPKLFEIELLPPD